MNVVTLMGRLTRDPDTKEYGKEGLLARYTLAVDRMGAEECDFIECVVFGKMAEFAEKYFKKGMRVCVNGSIQTGSYEGKNGEKRYTTNVVVNRQEFADSKKEEGNSRRR